MLKRLERWLSCQECLLIFQRTGVLSTRIKQLTTSSNSTFKDLLCSSTLTCTYHWHKYTQTQNRIFQKDVQHRQINSDRSHPLSASASNPSTQEMGEHHCKFEASGVYTVGSRLDKAIYETVVKQSYRDLGSKMAPCPYPGSKSMVLQKTSPLGAALKDT